MSKIRLYGSASGYAEITASSNAGDQSFSLPTVGGTLVTPDATQTLTNKTIIGSQGSVRVPGTIIQVVNATYSVSTTTSSSTYADTGLTATITPTSATSKVLVLINQAGCGKFTNNTFLQLRLLRGSTVLSSFDLDAGYTNTTTAAQVGTCSTSYLDSPATTSSTTYKSQFASSNNVAGAVVQSSSATSTITLIEVAA